MSTIVDRRQSRFIEELDRIDVVKPIHLYNRQSKAMQLPSSAARGPRLPETIGGMWMETNKDPKKLASLLQLPEHKIAITISGPFHEYGSGPLVDVGPKHKAIAQRCKINGRAVSERLRLATNYPQALPENAVTR
jgi:hypothetical protein